MQVMQGTSGFEAFRRALRGGDNDTTVVVRSNSGRIMNGDVHKLNQHAAQHINTSHRQRRRGFFLCGARTLLIDLPLCLLAALTLASCLIVQIHDEFYVPLFERAARSDAQLLEEYTYYERQCTEYDLSTRDMNDMLVETTTTTTTTTGDGNTTTTGTAADVETVVDQMLTHGGVVIPQVLQADTVRELRAYIQHKNTIIAENEQYPMSQGEFRLSYGIDASEDPTVSAAIAQVANHPVVTSILQNLLGDPDPASAEITAITNFAGADYQVWHQDTKQDGNALKFARTYSHSYSLFLPLQDINQKMGATDICPGTHMCANDLTDMCEENKMGLHMASTNEQGEDVLPAGYGALLNQHVWHRGGAHTDPSQPERIVFVLSFLARPKTSDPRQLSRGTYFHQKWNMWGHTLQDLKDPATAMRKPFSFLRCMSIWKPPTHNWGYDLVTSAFLRFVNEQLEEDDLEDRFLPRFDQWKFPLWLRGRLLQETSQREAWQVFIRETLYNVKEFMLSVALYVHAVYLVLLLLACTTLLLRRRPGGRLFFTSAIRLLVTHGILMAIAWKLLDQVRTSEWGREIANGHALMRPFPPTGIATTKQVETFVSSGVTTLPTRNDVLMGTRFDAQFLGSYDQWLDYHPGNVVFRQATEKFGKVYHHSTKTNSNNSNSTTMFANQLIQHVVHEIEVENDGRFLHQDFRTGDWRIMTTDEKMRSVAEELHTAGNALLASLCKSLDQMIADDRFGVKRGTVMARTSQFWLWNFKKQLLALEEEESLSFKSGISSSQKSVVVTTSTAVTNATKSTKIFAVTNVVSKMPKLKTASLKGPSSSIPDNPQEEFQVGTLVWAYFESMDEWFPGTIMEHDHDHELFDITFEDNTFEYDITRNQIRKFYPVTEGDRVEGCFLPDLQDCWPGTVLRVMPGGYVSIAYDDGELQSIVPPTRYYLPPFNYRGPYFY